MKTLTERTAAALAWIDSQIAICNAATDGPYEHTGGNGIHKRRSKHFAECVALTYGDKREENGAFIAAARTGYPEMLDGMKLAIRCLQIISSNEPDESKAGIAAYFQLSEILAKIEAL